MNRENGDLQAAISEQARAWVIKMHDAELLPEEKTDLQRWIAQSSAHKNELTRLARRWRQLDVLTELAVPRQIQSVTRKKDTALWTGLAAMAAALLFVMVLQPLGFHTSTTVYATAVGEQRQVLLPDKSTVLLNTNSAVQVSYTRARRGIQLIQGEAHFDVSPDPERPFYVQAGKSVVRAIGTAFSVYLKQQSVEVLVTEGRVALNSLRTSAVQTDPTGAHSAVEGTGSASTIINAGQAGSFDKRLDRVQRVENISPPDIDRKLSWREGLIKFSGDPLEQVVQEVSRYTTLTIVIVDPQLRDVQIGGLFKVGETQKLFEALEISFNVHVERISDQLIHLTSKKSDQ